MFLHRLAHCRAIVVMIVFCFLLNVSGVEAGVPIYRHNYQPTARPNGWRLHHPFYPKKPLQRGWRRLPTIKPQPVIQLTKNDRECLIRNVYWESAAVREPPEGDRMVAYVTLMRIVFEISGIVFAPHGKPESICDAVRAHLQFSWALDISKWISQLVNDDRYRAAVDAADAVLNGWVPPEPLQGALFYMRPAYSAHVSVCAFRAELFFIFEIGHHEFYTPPMDQYERRVLAEANKKKRDKCNEKTDYILIQEHRWSAEAKNP